MSRTLLWRRGPAVQRGLHGERDVLSRLRSREQDPGPRDGLWEIKFVAPFTQFPGCPGVTGTVTSIAIIFDEGNDVAVPPPSVGLSPGDVVLDNIRVNANVVG